MQAQAYEFYAMPENGMIKIPEEYREKIISGVKVIVLDDAPLMPKGDEGASRRKSDMLLPPTMSTTGWQFNREEANER